MDLSALIFVALAVAWAVYLIPKALRHHEEDAARRSVDSFSDRMRVLARREAVTASKAELVVGSRQAEVRVVEAEAEVEVTEEEPAPAPAPLSPLQLRLRRAAAARAARRRRRVLGTLFLATAVVVGLAAAAVIPWFYVAVPAALIVAWLVACRLMVRNERAARAAAPVRVRKRRRTLADAVIADEDALDDVAGEVDGDDTSEIAAVDAAPEPDPVPGGWDPVPVTLPTYVEKAHAGRTVRTIDLDSTGVWSSGRNAADSQLAREAESTARESADESERRRASGA